MGHVERIAKLVLVERLWSKCKGLCSYYTGGKVSSYTSKLRMNPLNVFFSASFEHQSMKYFFPLQVVTNFIFKRATMQCLRAALS